ncbi:hypothetical protein QR98_0073210 [Sarcoptes scabiei]|uniref:Uncharacterized protein n=1 Tax=Sarcoptes scabiei TaxID=52283 RepID=A0A132ACS3_SARSC|nr:hypothetical protein QR98_0073210 [Sarcoptes scabiei]
MITTPIITIESTEHLFAPIAMLLQNDFVILGLVLLSIPLLSISDAILKRIIKEKEEERGDNNC